MNIAWSLIDSFIWKWKEVLDNSILMTTFYDISEETKESYEICTPGTFVYFFKNRSGKITFLLKEKNIRLFVFGLYDDVLQKRMHLTTEQIHASPHTSSHILVKSLLQENMNFSHDGIIRIEKEASQSKAGFESRHLLLEKSAQAHAKPHLEILADDIQCSHAVTTSPINKDILFYLNSRGMTQKQASGTIAKGFFQAVYTKIDELRSSSS